MLNRAHAPSNFTAYHYACATGKIDVAAQLVLAGADTRLVDANGRTGKQVAEIAGHEAVVARLREALKQLIDINEVG